MAAPQINTQEILAWIQLSQQLATLGIDAANGIKNAIKAFRPGATDEELNAIVQGVINDATRRKLLAESDARGEGPQPPAQPTQ